MLILFAKTDRTQLRRRRSESSLLARDLHRECWRIGPDNGKSLGLSQTLQVHEWLHLDSNDHLNPNQGKRIREKVRVEPAIQAYDQDSGINARLRYSIVLGNEEGFFEMNAQTGELFLIREIDLEKLSNPTLSLQIQASQVDNPLRQVLARVDISVQDVNDNSPEVSETTAGLTVKVL